MPCILPDLLKDLYGTLVPRRTAPEWRSWPTRVAIETEAVDLIRFARVDDVRPVRDFVPVRGRKTTLRCDRRVVVPESERGLGL